MRNIDACGCGQDFALGVLYSTQKELETVKTIL